MSEGPYCYPYPRPMVTVDAVVFSHVNGMRQVLLIERKHDPWAGCWALPGGFLEMGESLEGAVARELAEETGLYGVKLVQFHTFGAVDRDPRGRVITVAYTGVVAHPPEGLRAADDAAAVRWWPVDLLPVLAADHEAIVRQAMLVQEREGWTCA